MVASQSKQSTTGEDYYAFSSMGFFHPTPSTPKVQQNNIQPKDYSLCRSLSSLGLLGSNLRFSVMSCLQLLNVTGTLSSFCFLGRDLSFSVVGFAGFNLNIAGTLTSLCLLSLWFVS